MGNVPFKDERAVPGDCHAENVLYVINKLKNVQIALTIEIFLDTEYNISGIIMRSVEV